MPATGGEPVVRRRRRGMELQDAIHQAVLGELQEHGYAALSMDGVASRAQTGKATLYRRWPSKLELVVDAFKHSAPDTSPRRTAVTCGRNCWRYCATRPTAWTVPLVPRPAA